MEQNYFEPADNAVKKGEINGFPRSRLSRIHRRKCKDGVSPMKE